MKNRFYIVIIALVLLAMGCTKTEMSDTKEKAVAFQVGNYAPQTKAESIIVVDGIESFSSRGYLHAEGVPGKQDFFGAGETITWNATKKEWAPSHDYFWPKSKDSYVNFISWVGGTPAITYTKAEEAGAKWTATFAWNNVTVAPTDNLLWADMAWRYNANVNPATYGSTFQASNGAAAEGVPTLFHHALAQVRFMGKVSKTSDTDGKVNWVVNVTDLSLTNVINKGTLSMSNTDPESTEPNAWTVTSWATTTSTETIAPGTADTLPVALDGTEKQIIGYKSVLPQDVTNDMVLTVNYTVTTTYNTNVKTVVENATASAKLSAFSGSISAWEMNKRYTYIFSINPDTGIIKIIPVETDWIVESEYPINIE